MRILAVNQPYPGDIGFIPPNSGGIDISNGNKDMFVKLLKPNSNDIATVQEGRGRFWLIYMNGVIIIQFRFQSNANTPDIEGAYIFHIGLYDKIKAPCSIEHCEAGMSYLFTFALLEHETLIIKALRSFTLNANFIEKFKELIKKQRTEYPDTGDFYQRCREILSTNSLKKLREKAICYCNGGQDSKKAA